MSSPELKPTALYPAESRSCIQSPPPSIAEVYSQYDQHFEGPPIKIEPPEHPGPSGLTPAADNLTEQLVEPAVNPPKPERQFERPPMKIEPPEHPKPSGLTPATESSGSIEALSPHNSTDQLVEPAVKPPKPKRQFDRPFGCEQCAKAFETRWQLNVHRRSHTDERPFSCELCDKTYKSKPHLTNHMRMHSGFQPYQCAHCPKTFTLWSTLRNHERTHTGERPFVCEVCDKSFTQMWNLRTHMRSHAAEAEAASGAGAAGESGSAEAGDGMLYCSGN